MVSPITQINKLIFVGPISCALANWYSFKTLSVVAPCILALTNLASFYCIQRDERLLYMVAFGFFGGMYKIF